MPPKATETPYVQEHYMIAPCSLFPYELLIQLPTNAQSKLIKSIAKIELFTILLLFVYILYSLFHVSMEYTKIDTSFFDI